MIAGGSGMVGSSLADYCRSLGDEVLACDHQSLDIADRDLVMAKLRHDRPDAVLNCAAWTDVDGCEVDREHALAANALGPENLALACLQFNARFVTISTDYVFDGEKEGFYTQRDQPQPQSVYGLSKLEGERRSQTAYARTIVVRTGFVFGPGGNNFLSTIIERAQQGEKLKAIGDAFGTPTYARDLARRLRELAELDLPGIFHVVNSGDGTSFEGFARAALDLGGCSSTSVEVVASSSLNRPAPRPRNSRLRCLLSEALGLTPLPSWTEALADFVNLNSHTEFAARK